MLSMIETIDKVFNHVFTAEHHKELIKVWTDTRNVDDSKVVELGLKFIEEEKAMKC